MKEYMEQAYAYTDKTTTFTGVGVQYADVSLHIKAKPHAGIGMITADCCGEPTVAVHQACSDTGCEIIITQSICIRIPVLYSTTAEVEELTVSCKKAPEDVITS